MGKKKITKISFCDGDECELPFPIYIAPGYDFTTTAVMVVCELVKGLLERLEKGDNECQNKD